MTLEVGDEVRYVPSICHAKEIMPDGSFAWDFTGSDTTGRRVVLTTEQVKKKMDYLCTYRGRNDPNKDRVLTPLRPRTTWAATVVAVNPDGTVDLGISHPIPGIGLGYKGITVDPTQKVAHSCHKA